jgi:hypothetical protein
MKSKFFALLLIVTTTSLLACSDKAKPSETGSTEGAAGTAAPAATVSNNAGSLPPMPKERLQNLWDNCDYIDFVFFDLDFSMSQEEKSAIQGTVAGIGANAPTLNPACKPIGRVFFQVAGKNVEEADLVMGQGCVYYIFQENGKPAYANLLTERGFKFYQDVFTQVLGQ